MDRNEFFKFINEPSEKKTRAEILREIKNFILDETYIDRDCLNHVILAKAI